MKEHTELCTVVNKKGLNNLQNIDSTNGFHIVNCGKPFHMKTLWSSLRLFQTFLFTA